MWAQPRRLLDLGARGAGAAIGDVVEDRVVEQHGVLRHHADRAAQAVLRHVADVLAVDLDRAAIDIVEAEQQARDRRFAGAARPDDRDGGAGRNAKIDVLQDRAARIVAEIDMAKRDLAALDDQRRRARPVLDLGLQRQQRRSSASRSVSDCLMLR